ncbi:MAG: hypothetical protein WAZ98_06300 [Cyclobacteriaceae bacterium]
MTHKFRTLLVFFLLVLTVVVLVVSTQPVYAQPGGGGDPCPFPPCNPDVPISGIEILLAAGGVFGVKKILGAMKRSKKDNQ